MKTYWIFTISSLPVAGLALFPFIIICDHRFKSDKVLINHERIHLRQQLEMMIVPFYIVYLLHYLINLLKYKKHSVAYYNIAFEREAYKMDRNLDHLRNRTFWAWTKYFGK